MPGSLLPAALPDLGNNRVVAVRVASHPHPNAGENWLEDAAAAQKDRLQDSRHAPVAITERTNRALHRSEWGRGVNLPMLSWVEGGLQRELSLTFGVNNAPRYTLSA